MKTLATLVFALAPFGASLLADSPELDAQALAARDLDTQQLDTQQLDTQQLDTQQLDTQQLDAQQLARELVAAIDGPRAKAIRIFDYVRDEIEYGFTKRFDRADTEFTLKARRGHCNPQTELFVTMLEAIGIEARQVFVTIEPDILDGLMPPQAAPLRELNHSFAEVKLDGQWLRVDGYAVDPALLGGAKVELEKLGTDIGFGAHVDSCIRWDGRSDCMGQFVSPEMLRAGGEHGAFEDANDFYTSAAYTQRMKGVTRVLYRWLGKTMMNRKLDRVRRQAPPTEPLQAGG